MRNIHKRYRVKKRCKFCGMIHDGFEFITKEDEDNGLTTEVVEVKNTCDCSEEKITDKIRKRCFICGSRLHKQPKTLKRLISYFVLYGNCCSYCSHKTGVDAIENKKKKNEIIPQI